VRDTDFTKILAWPGYRVYHHAINEAAKTLRLWVRRKRRPRPLIYSGSGRRVRDVHDVSEREVRDLPWGEYRTTVMVEIYRLRCPDCGVKIERVAQLPSKAPFS
jgi:transposase